MGLFSAIGNVLSDMSEQSNNARADAEKLSTKSICNQLRYAGFSAWILGTHDENIRYSIIEKR